jgi:hypothetical protein
MLNESATHDLATGVVLIFGSIGELYADEERWNAICQVVDLRNCLGEVIFMGFGQRDAIFYFVERHIFTNNNERIQRESQFTLGQLGGVCINSFGVCILLSQLAGLSCRSRMPVAHTNRD